MVFMLEPPLQPLVEEPLEELDLLVFHQVVDPCRGNEGTGGRVASSPSFS